MTISGHTVLVAAVGAAEGSKVAAAALTCAASDADRPGLLIDVGGRPPRPTLIASAGARELEERLARHLPDLRAASRGQTCHLAVPVGDSTFEAIRAALPLVRGSAAVVHLPPALLQAALGEAGIRSSAVLLRADLPADRPLTALAVGDLLGRDLLVRVLKRPLPWVSARRALFGILPSTGTGGLPRRLRENLFGKPNSAEHTCYSEPDDEEADPERTSKQQWGDHARTGRRRGLHRHSQRQAGR
jgi:hypothetical protein